MKRSSFRSVLHQVRGTFQRNSTGSCLKRTTTSIRSPIKERRSSPDTPGGISSAFGRRPRSFGEGTFVPFAADHEANGSSCCRDADSKRGIQRRRGLSGAAAAPPSSGSVIGSSEVEREGVDSIVIGAGVVGLAIARQLAMKGREVIVVEAAEGIGTGTSSRNSEVIHAGLYYATGSLKARMCVEGKHAMYAYCKEREIPHKNVGKLIVATGQDHIPVLEKLEKLGKQNNVSDLHIISGDQAMQLEPSLRCVKALVSPSTGIVDSHEFMLALQTDAEQLGVTFAFNSAVIEGSVNGSRIDIGVAESPSLASSTSESSLPSDAGEIMILSAKTVVNAAGLFSQSVARRIRGLPSETIPKAHYAKGCYFNLSGVGKPPFSRLIYPVPEEAGVGVHVTMDLGGQIRFGPDVEWLPHMNDDTLFPTEIDYSVDPRRGEKFYAEIRKYYPDLPDDALQPGYSGIRAKLLPQGQPSKDLPSGDFIIQGEGVHGVPGLINLYGIESPGLTSSLAIAKHVGTLI